MTRRAFPYWLAAGAAVAAAVLLLLVVGFGSTGASAETTRARLSSREDVSWRRPTTPPRRAQRQEPSVAPSGLVKTADGTAAALVDVCVVQREPRGDRVRACVKTDTRGRYRFDALPLSEGQYDLLFTSDTQGSTRLENASSSSAAEVEMQEQNGQQARRLAGTVLDAGGGPIAGAEITVVSSVDGALTAAGTSDETGAFSMHVLAREVAVTARAVGYGPQSLETVLSNESLRLVLAPAATVNGIVVDIAGQTVAEATVELSSADTARTLPTSTQSDTQGGFTFPAVAPGRYRLAARTSRMASSPLFFSVAPADQTTPLTLTLEGGASLVARVFLGAEPCSEGGVQVIGETAEQKKTDPEGVVALYNLRPGKSVVAAYCTGAESERRSVELAGDKPLQLEFRLSSRLSVAGTVLGADQEPVPQPRLIISRGGSSRDCRGDETGGFRCIGLDPGEYQLQAFNQRGHIVSEPVSFTLDDHSVEGIILRALAVGRLTVVVRNPEKLQGVNVFAYRGEVLAAEGTRVNGDEFLLEGLEPGSYVVYAGNSTRIVEPATVSLDGTADAQKVTVNAPKAATLFGAVTDEDGAPLPDITLRATDPQQFVGEPSALAPTITDAEGRFVIDSIPPGDYDVVLSGRDGEVQVPRVSTGEPLTLSYAPSQEDPSAALPPGFADRMKEEYGLDEGELP
jgi:protocatechuate 3,4-dioxygenase beta subunit